MNVEIAGKVLLNTAGYIWADASDSNVSEPAPSVRSKRAAPRRELKLAEPWSLEPTDPFSAAPALFLEFANLEITEKAILRFANEHGILAEPSGPVSFERYEYAILEMREAVELWRAVQAEDHEVLGQYVSWKRGKLNWTSDLACVRDESGHVKWTLGARQELESVASNESPSYKAGDIIGPAIALLDFVLNTRSVWSTETDAGVVGGGFRTVRRRNVVTFRMLIPRLLDALWWQFALAVTEDRKYATCLLCEKSFESGPGAYRADREYCSDNCRVKAHQRKKRQVLELHQAGKKLREIASTTGITPTTIQRWIVAAQVKGEKS